MITVVGVDLAAKYSAVCWMGHLGSVIEQWDTWGRTEQAFINLLVAPFRHCPVPPAVLAIEDLPHRLPFASLVKNVCRLQGRIVQAMDDIGMLERVLFVPPAEWRKTFPGLERGTGPDAVIPVASRQGYTPPDLSDRIRRSGHITIARKVASDYCAAFLIARWALSTWDENATFDVLGTSRYGSGPVKARK